MIERETTISGEALEALRRQLLAGQRALFKEVEGVESDLSFLEEDRESEAEEHAQGEAMARLLARLDDREKQELVEIHRALANIAARSYGRCEQCGEAIGLERLRAVPAARRCLPCERAWEASRAAAVKPFEPGSHRPVPAEYADLSDDELAEAVRDLLAEQQDPDLFRIEVRCHGGVVRLSGEVPSEPQRQVVLQVVTDRMGLEALDRLRVATLDREDVGESREAGAVEEGIEEISAGRTRETLRPAPQDEGEPPSIPPDRPVPEKE
jgi:DnaK suppressor protein